MSVLCVTGSQCVCTLCDILPACLYSVWQAHSMSVLCVSQAHSVYLQVEEEALKVAKEMNAEYWAVSSKTGAYDVNVCALHGVIE